MLKRMAFLLNLGRYEDLNREVIIPIENDLALMSPTKYLFRYGSIEYRALDLC